MKTELLQKRMEYLQKLRQEIETLENEIEQMSQAERWRAKGGEKYWQIGVDGRGIIRIS